MDANRAQVLQESKRSLSKLQLLAVFFEDEIIYGIQLRSQVIHNLYEGSAELDIGRLELFHLQYTASILELLRKVKKANEALVATVYEEIDLNRNLEERLQHMNSAAKELKGATEKQVRQLSISLRKAYGVLSEGSSEYPFSNNLSQFSTRYASEFFDPVPDGTMVQIMTYAPAEVYTSEHITIHRKLLGLLNKHGFAIRFFDGLKAGAITAEVYRLVAADVYFSFFPGKNIFLFVTPADVPALDGLLARSKKETFLHNVQEKVGLLQSRIHDYKTHLPTDIKPLLSEYLQKIQDPSFLQDSAGFDVYANILKTMLSTTSL